MPPLVKRVLIGFVIPTGNAFGDLKVRRAYFIEALSIRF
jgi:hypothetical protein